MKSFDLLLVKFDNHFLYSLYCSMCVHTVHSMINIHGIMSVCKISIDILQICLIIRCQWVVYINTHQRQVKVIVNWKFDLDNEAHHLIHCNDFYEDTYHKLYRRKSYIVNLTGSTTWMCIVGWCSLLWFELFSEKVYWSIQNQLHTTSLYYLRHIAINYN